MKAKFAKASKDGDARRTKIDKNSNVGGGFVVKDYVPNIPSVISISKLGYIKRTPLADFRIQNRGGTGKTGAKLRKGSDKAPEDFILNVYNCMAHDELLFFTSHGRLFQKGAYELQESDCNTMGKPVQNFIDLRPERLEGTKDKDGKELPYRPAERVLDIIAVKSFEKDEQAQLDKQYVFFATKKGVVKRTLLSEYKNVRSSGLNAISIDEDDELIAVTLVEDNDKIMLISANGKCIKFAATAARKMGRTAHGVRGIRLDGVTFKDPEPDDAPAAGEEEDSVQLDENGKLIVDELRTMVKVPAGSEDNLYLVTIVDNGYGKRTPVASYPTKNRGGKGVIDIKTTARNGKVVFASLVECLPQDEPQQPVEGADPATVDANVAEQSAAKGAAVLLMTRGGTSLMTYVRNVSISNRNTMGVRVVRVDKEDAVSSGTIISAETAQEIERIRKALEEEKNGAAAEQAPTDSATAEPPAAEAPAAEPTPEA
jgi:DNA gyrase subunit A